ncbi:hypothetical protein FRC07_009431, partial [Ceratobasidium sp. 392]
MLGADQDLMLYLGLSPAPSLGSLQLSNLTKLSIAANAICGNGMLAYLGNLPQLQYLDLNLAAENSIDIFQVELGPDTFLSLEHFGIINIPRAEVFYAIWNTLPFVSRLISVYLHGSLNFWESTAKRSADLNCPLSLVLKEQCPLIKSLAVSSDEEDLSPEIMAAVFDLMETLSLQEFFFNLPHHHGMAEKFWSTDYPFIQRLHLQNQIVCWDQLEYYAGSMPNLEYLAFLISGVDPKHDGDQVDSEDFEDIGEAFGANLKELRIIDLSDPPGPTPIQDYTRII